MEFKTQQIIKVCLLLLFKQQYTYFYNTFSPTHIVTTLKKRY